jgi:hypothetical protein
MFDIVERFNEISLEFEKIEQDTSGTHYRKKSNELEYERRSS